MTHPETPAYRFNLEEAEQSIKSGMQWFASFYARECHGLDSIDSAREKIKEEMSAMVSNARQLAASGDTDGAKKRMMPIFGCFRLMFYSNEHGENSNLLNSMYPRALEAKRMLGNFLSAPREESDNNETVAEWDRMKTVLKNAQLWEDKWPHLNRIVREYEKRKSLLDLSVVCKDKEDFLYNLCKPFIQSALPDVAACLELSCDPIAGTLTMERKGNTLLGELVSTAPTLRQLNFMWRIPFLHDAAKSGPEETGDAIMVHLRLQNLVCSESATDEDVWQNVCRILRHQLDCESELQEQPHLGDALSAIQKHLPICEQIAAATAAALPLCETDKDFLLLAEFAIKTADKMKTQSFIAHKGETCRLYRSVPEIFFTPSVSNASSDPKRVKQWERFADCLEEEYGEHGMAYMARKCAEQYRDENGYPCQKTGAYEELMQNAGFFRAYETMVCDPHPCVPKCPDVPPSARGTLSWIEKNAALSSAWRLFEQINERETCFSWPPARFHYILDAALTYQDKNTHAYSAPRFDRRGFYDLTEYNINVREGYPSPEPGMGFCQMKFLKKFAIVQKTPPCVLTESGVETAIRILYRLFVAQMFTQAAGAVKDASEGVDDPWEKAFAAIRETNKELSALSEDFGLPLLIEDIKQTEWLENIEPEIFVTFMATAKTEPEPEAKPVAEPIFEEVRCFENALGALRHYDGPVAAMIKNLEQETEPYMPSQTWNFLKKIKNHIETIHSYHDCGENFTY